MLLTAEETRWFAATLSRCQPPAFEYFHREGEEGGGFFLQARWPYGINKSPFQKFVYLTLNIICLCGPFALHKNVIQHRANEESAAEDIAAPVVAFCTHLVGSVGAFRACRAVGQQGLFLAGALDGGTWAVRMSAGCWVLEIRCWMLVVRCRKSDVGYWMLGVESWMLEVGCWNSGVGYW